jgi:hypothetical protein
MSQETPKAFFSYSREDTTFVLQLAKDLRAAGANVWLDQLDIRVGDRWDASVEDALHKCPRVILVVSPGSVASNNVMDEVSFAIDEHKTVIPVLIKDCKVPFRLRRLQYLDARSDYQGAVRGLLRLLGVESGHATSQPVLMLDDAMFDKSPAEEAKEPRQGMAATAAAVAPAVAPTRREPEPKAPAASPAAIAKPAPAGTSRTKSLAIAGGAAVALGVVIWLVGSLSSRHDPQPAPQAQATTSAPVNAPAQTAAPASAAVPAATPDSPASSPAQTSSAAAPARHVPPSSAPVDHVAKAVPSPTESHPVASPPPSPTPAASAPPPETRAAAAAPSITLPAIFVFKTRSKLHSYTPLRVLGGGSDRLTLNTDGSFALKQGKQTLNGNFTLSGPRLVLNAPNRSWTNTIDGNTMVDEDGSTWVRQK